MAGGVEVGSFLLPLTSVVAQVSAPPVRHVRQAAGRYAKCSAKIDEGLARERWKVIEIVSWFYLSCIVVTAALY